MSSEVAETIFEKVKDLPPEQQHEVLDFVESLATAAATQSGQTLWEDIRKIVEDVSDEAWEALPRDGSLNVDYYLYGAPKK